jgi:thiamine-monophosphate kinase
MRELELLDALQSIVTPPAEAITRSIGDDAAVLACQGPVVVSVDQTVAGIHADLRFFGPSEFGARSVLSAISDLAAMGAMPTAVLLAIVFPAGTDIGFATDLIKGADEAANSCGASVIGGDVSSGPALTAGVTAIGALSDGQAAIGRDGAQPGDLIAVTGSLGGSAAGLEILRGIEGPSRLAERHIRPTPRTLEGVALARAGVSSMIDISDGLATDALHIAQASEVAIAIDGKALPLDQGVEQVALSVGRDPLEFASTGGEDFELLLTFNRNLLDAVREAAGEPGLTVIGEVDKCEEPTVAISGSVGLSGWEHET